MAKRVGTGNEKILPGLVIPTTKEAEVGQSKAQSLPGLHSELRAHLDKSARLLSCKGKAGVGM